MRMGLLTTFSTASHTSRAIASAARALTAVSSCWSMCPLKRSTVTSVVAAFGGAELEGMMAGWVMFVACHAAVAYVKEPGTRLTAPCIPRACWELAVMPLLPFFLLLLLLRQLLSSPLQLGCQLAGE